MPKFNMSITPLSVADEMEPMKGIFEESVRMLCSWNERGKFGSCEVKSGQLMCVDWSSQFLKHESVGMSKLGTRRK